MWLERAKRKIQKALAAALVQSGTEILQSRNMQLLLPEGRSWPGSDERLGHAADIDHTNSKRSE